MSRFACGRLGLATFVASFGLFAAAQNAGAAVIYADLLVDSECVTGFKAIGGSDATFGNVTGAPDNGGLFLADTPDADIDRNSGFITVRFFAGISCTFAEVCNLRVIDRVGGENDQETFNISISIDGESFTSVGEANALPDQNGVDLLSVPLPDEPFFFVKVASSSGMRPPPTFQPGFSVDVDTVEHNFVPIVPEPGTGLLRAAGLGAIAWQRRRSHRR